MTRLPYRLNLLIDGGGSSEYSSYDAGRYEFLPYLRDNGITNIDIAFVSHFHKDHVMGIVAAIEELNVKTLCIPDNHPNDELRQLLIKTANQNNTEIKYITKDETINFSCGITVDVMLPHDNFILRDMNEMEAVYRVNYGEFSVLFTGDIGTDTENLLCNKKVNLKSDVLKVPHHGSSKSSSERFLKYVEPKCAVAGIGVDNVYDFPRPQILARYEKYGIPFLYTAKNGNILIKSNKDASFRIYRN